MHNFQIWLNEVWSTIATPQWMANTGLPLFATLLGVAFGFFFLRYQLKNDLVLRNADRLEDASLTLGTSITKALEHFELPAKDPFWANGAWPDREVLKRAREDALLLLAPAELTELDKLIQDITSCWAACLIGARRVNETPDKAIHRHAMKRVLQPYIECLKDQSELLRAWDGRKSVPEKGLIPTELHMPVENDRDWMDERRESYEDVFNGRAGILLVKSLGEPL